MIIFILFAEIVVYLFGTKKNIEKPISVYGLSMKSITNELQQAHFISIIHYQLRGKRI